MLPLDEYNAAEYHRMLHYGQGAYPQRSFAAPQQRYYYPKPQDYPQRPHQPTLHHMWPAAQQPRPMAPPMYAAPQAAAPPPVNGVPPNSFMVAYDFLSPLEAEMSSTLTADEFLEPLPTERPSLGPTSSALACEVCNAYEPLPNLGNLSSADLYVRGRQPQQTHQCVVCGVIVHRVCYGVSAGLLSSSIFVAGSSKVWQPPSEVPLLAGFVERQVFPKNRTPYCRFLCDLCLHVANTAARASSPPDILNQTPLGGRCVLCAGRRGPRKLVRIDRVENSLLPPNCFAHPFCILTACRGICDVPDWRTLSDIVIHEAVLQERRAQIEASAATHFSCVICRDESIPAGAGLSLELCKHFQEPLEGDEGGRCPQLFHAHCLRQFMSEYDQRDAPTYVGAYESCVSPRALPQGPLSQSLAFGRMGCLIHSFQSEEISSAHPRRCGACRGTCDEHYTITTPQHLRQQPVQWTRCKFCATNLHTFCYERQDGMCSRCTLIAGAFRVLEEEWLSAPAAGCSDLARFRVASERFTASLVGSLMTSSPPTILADAFATVVSCMWFDPHNGPKVVPCSLQTFLILKGIHTKRLREWTLAIEPSPNKPSLSTHPLVSEDLPALTAWLTDEQPPAPSTEPSAPVMRKRILMKKQSKPPSTPQAKPASAGLDVLAALAAKDAASASENEGSSTIGKGSAVGSRSKLTSCRARGKLQRVQTERPRKRLSGPDMTPAEESRKKRKLETDVTRPGNLKSLECSCSIFSLLLLLSLSRVLPYGSKAEAADQATLKAVCAAASQRLEEVAGELILDGPDTDTVPSLVLFIGRSELLRRMSLILHPALIPTDEVPLLRFTGALFMKSMVAMGPKCNLLGPWKELAPRMRSIIEDIDQKALTLLHLSVEFESVRWLGLLSLMEVVVGSRTDPSVNLFQSFQMKELVAIDALLSQTKVVACMDTPAVRHAHLRQYAALLHVLRMCMMTDVSILDDPDQVRSLPNPFFISVASHYLTSPGFGPLSIGLLPPCILFHAITPQTQGGLQTQGGPSLLQSIEMGVSLLNTVSRDLHTALTAPVCDLDRLRALLTQLQSLQVPSDATEILGYQSKLEAQIELGNQLEICGEESRKDSKNVREFVRVFLQEPGKTEPPPEAGMFPADLVTQCSGGKFTSAQLRQLPQLVSDLDLWRRQYAKLRAMVAPVEVGDRSSTQQARKRGKLRLTAGGAVKVAGETGFLRPTAQATPSEQTVETGESGRLVFTNQVSYQQGIQLLTQGKAIGVVVPELEELEGWILLADIYSRRVSFLEPRLDSLDFLKLLNPSSTMSVDDLSARLPCVRPPCLLDTTIKVALAYELQLEYAALPFSLSCHNAKLTLDCISAIREFLTALQSLVKSCLTTSQSAFVDLERELIDTYSNQLGQDLIKPEKKKTLTRNFNSWLTLADEIFTVVQNSDDSTSCYVTSSAFCNESEKELFELSKSRLAPSPSDVDGKVCLTEYWDICCPDCQRLHDQLEVSSHFKKCLTALAPYIQVLTDIHKFVLIERLPVKVVAAHILKRISVDPRFHPVSPAAVLVDEQQMIQAYQCLCLEVTQVNSKASPWSIIFLNEIDEVDTDLLRRWRLIGINLLWWMYKALEGILTSCHEQPKLAGPWRHCLCQGILLLANSGGLTEASEDIFNVTTDVNIAIPWPDDFLHVLMLRSLSILGLFRHYLTDDESNPLVLTLHDSLQRLLCTVEEPTFDRSIFAIVRQSTWEARTHETILQVRKDLARGRISSLQALAASVKEVDSLTGPSGLTESAQKLYAEAETILKEAVYRGQALIDVIPWIRGLNNTESIFASETLMLNLITQRLRQSVPNSSKKDTLAVELQALLSSCSDFCGDIKQPPQMCLLWRLCRPTSRLLLTPPAAPLFDVSPDVVGFFVRSATVLTNGAWSPLSSNSLPGQMAVVEALRLSSSNPPLGAVLSALIQEAARVAKTALQNGDHRLIAAFSGPGAGGGGTSAPQPVTLMFSMLDSEAGWTKSLADLPWAALFIVTWLQGVASATIDYDELGLHDFDNQSPDEEPASADSIDTAAELSAFVRLCESRSGLLRGFATLTVPAEWRQVDEDDCSEPAPTEAPLDPGVVRVHQLRRALSIGADHNEWLASAAKALAAKPRDISELRSLGAQFVTLRAEVLDLFTQEEETAGSAKILPELLFGQYARDWTQRIFAAAKSSTSVADMFIGGLLILELRRSLALFEFAFSNVDMAKTGIPGLKARAAALTEALMPADIPAPLRNSTTLALLRDLPALQVLLESTTPADAWTKDESDTRLRFFPDCGKLVVPICPIEVRHEVEWIERIFAVVVQTVLQEDADVEASPQAAVSVLAHLTRLLVDGDLEDVSVVGAKLIWSLLMDECVMVCVAIQGKSTRNGGTETRLKFIHPITLLACIEAVPVLSLLTAMPDIENGLRRHMEWLAKSGFKLTRSINVLVKLLALRISVSADAGGALVAFKLASDVLGRVEVLMSNSFPMELLDAVRNLCGFKLNPVQAALPEVANLLEAVRETRGAAQVFGPLESRVQFLIHHPAKVCLFDLGEFQQTRQNFLPLVEKAQAFLSGHVVLTDDKIVPLLEQSRELTARTNVVHPTLEILSMYHQERVSLVHVIEDTLGAYRLHCERLLKNGQKLFDHLYRQAVALHHRAPSSGRPQPSPLLLLHFWDMSGLVRSNPIPVATLSTLLNWRRRLNELLCPNRPPDADLRLEQPIQIFASLTDCLQKADQAIGETLGELTLAIDGKLPLAMFPRLFFLPALPPDISAFLSRIAATPDFVQVLGLPSPFGLLDIGLAPHVEVGRAIATWTVFILQNAFTVLEVHHVLFGGPSDPSVSSEEGLQALQMSQSLGQDEAFKRASPIWQAAVNKLLVQLLAVGVLLLSESGRPAPTEVSWRALLQVQAVRKLGGSSGNDGVEWALKTLATYPAAWQAVNAFLQATCVPKVFFRYVWEAVTVVLPCKGDPYTSPYHQPVTFDAATNGFVLAPLSGTIYRLFSMSKQLVRDVRVENVLPTLEMLLNALPPPLHPLVRAFIYRETPRQPEPTNSWVRRAERLAEALKNNLHHTKLLLAEGRVSIDAFLVRLAMQGLCPVTVTAEDLAGLSAKLETKFSVRIETSPGLLASAKMEPLPSDNGLRHAEIHRALWMGSTTAASLVLSYAARRGTAQTITTASPQVATWIQKQVQPDTRARMIALCRSTTAMSTEIADLYDLAQTICLLMSMPSDAPIVPGPPNEILRKLGNLIDEPLFKAVYFKPAPANPEVLLLTLLSHCIISPFSLAILGHPNLVAAQAADLEGRPAKALYPPLLAFSKFLNFHIQDPPKTADEVFLSSTEALNKSVVTRVASHISRRFFGDSNSSNGLFFPSDGQGDQASKAAPPVASLPPPSPLMRLVPELSSILGALGFDQKRNVIEDKFGGRVAWWGPLVALGSDSPMSTTMTTTLIRHAAAVDSPVIDTLMRNLVRFVKAPSTMTQAHFMECIVNAKTTEDICSQCRKMCLESTNPAIESPWTAIEVEGNFARAGERISANEDARLAAVPLMLKPVLPLRMPILLLPEHLEPLLVDLMPPVFTQAHCKNCSSRTDIPLGSVNAGLQVSQYDGVFSQQARKFLPPNLRVTLFVGLSATPFHSAIDPKGTNTLPLRQPVPVNLFGSLIIWSTPPSPTALVREPSFDSVTILDAESACLHLRGDLECLSRAVAELRRREPLLPSIVSSHLRSLVFPDFLRGCRRRFAVQRRTCANHGLVITVDLAPLGSKLSIWPCRFSPP